MQAHRALIETDERGRATDLPTLPRRAKIEAIFLVLELSAKTTTERHPPVSLAGLKIMGDIIGPAVDGGERR